MNPRMWLTEDRPYPLPPAAVDVVHDYGDGTYLIERKITGSCQFPTTAQYQVPGEWLTPLEDTSAP